ncbi:GntP family transporter [Cryobacterium arcticum]|uniref:Putative transporter n=1 Tax=Cryobacterium arcticum TaxID=670052 RepID=A0A1B1BKX2_9MICO|nr:GntP family transporter [Cryobacterium arcticum]ANP73272.1 Putative transporter [Cryobacterium arcticum]
MNTAILLGIAAGGIALLLVLIIRFKVQAFVALLLVSLLVALAAGIPLTTIPATEDTPERLGVIQTIVAGMGGTLGTVAILVALGAMLGRLIEVSGGAASLAGRFTTLLGPKRVSAALTAAALVLAIPVFFDVGFIILVPIIYGFCKVAGVNPVKFGLPVAGIMLAVHVAVPPHPGIVGGSALLGTDLGWVTIIGLGVAVPLGFLAHFVSKLLNRREFTMLPATAVQFAQFGTDSTDNTGGADSSTGGGSSAGSTRTGTLTKTEAPPTAGTILTLILVPLVLIMSGTLAATLLPAGDPLRPLFAFIGAPIFALLVALLLAFYLLTVRRGWSLAHTGDVLEAALPPAAIVILVTGAGGAFAKVLTESGIGTALSDALTATGLPILVLAFLISLVLRVSQGSATVAILSTAGLIAENVAASDYSVIQVALITLSVAFGALGLSHVNDSGFWVVTRYLGLSVADGLRTWTVLTTVLGVAGFLIVSLLWLVVGLGAA